MWSLCLRFAEDRDDAEDLFQTAWIRIWERRRTFPEVANVEAWLHRLTVNSCRSFLRREARHRREKGRMQFEEPVGSAAIGDPRTRLDRLLTAESVEWALSTLPARQSEAIRLRFLEELSSEEAAARMGVSTSTVRSHIRHGLKRLRVLLS